MTFVLYKEGHKILFIHHKKKKKKKLRTESAWAFRVEKPSQGGLKWAHDTSVCLSVVQMPEPSTEGLQKENRTEFTVSLWRTSDRAFSLQPCNPGIRHLWLSKALSPQQKKRGLDYWPMRVAVESKEKALYSPDTQFFLLFDKKQYCFLGDRRGALASHIQSHLESRSSSSLHQATERGMREQVP